ncbi:hypothetical protein Ddye_010755 [Dipteronia dyeriana]|uniref:Uncharacterized protein n=1 Tax=Dipteronia dyeriana TaxID=168575 RepID=A0AAE0CP43_9ROSI|nr:hypothetical protein Ddye_010755 [Dipteronia dyeriana]
MNLKEEQQHEVSPSSSVLSRLDRLDNLVQLLEESHPSIGVIRKMKKEDDFKTLSSALEEVHRKGTLIERLTLLENRVLHLSLEMEAVGYSLGSSSEKVEERLDFEQQSGLVIQESRSERSRTRTRGRRWFRMGC